MNRIRQNGRRPFRLLGAAMALVLAGVAAGQETFQMEYLAHYRDGVGEIVEDPQSKTGRAKLSRKAETERSIMMFFYCPRPYPGHYRLSLRVKHGNAEEGEPIFSLRALCGHQTVLSRPFSAQDLGPEDRYGVASVDFPYRRENATFRVEVRYEGGADLWLDWVLLERLKVFSDAELLEWAGAAVPAMQPRAKDDVTHVNVVEGPFYEHYCGRWMEQFVPGLKLTETTVREGQAQDVPHEAAFWQSVDVLVLANVGIRVLDAYERNVLAQYVRSGGNLLITGGLHSLGKGMYYKTFLEDVLPVKTSGPWDVVKAAEPLRLNPVDEFAQPIIGLEWGDPPWVLYYHKVTLREDAQVLIKAGEQPFLVSGGYGKGKVAVLCAPALGKTAPAGGQLFFRWDQWRKLMASLVMWMDRS